VAYLTLAERKIIATPDIMREPRVTMRPELRALVERATQFGTETGKQTAKLMAEFTFAGIELAGEFSARFARMASGVLAGMADALQQRKTPDK